MSTIIFGRNAVRASLETNRVRTLYAATRFQNDPFVALARKKNVPVKFVGDGELTRMARVPSHQGFVAISDDCGTISLDELISSASKRKYPLLAMLDGIEDPHNLGAILRSADAFGVDGLIIKKRGEVPLNGTVAKVSTGAINYVKVAEVANLSQAIEILKKKSYWIVASDGGGTRNYDQVDYKCPICLVIGSEGFGIQPLVLKHSDFIVKIPMFGHVNSLNASVAASVLFAEVNLKRQ
ncbi:MAG: 23S rRNA (guanosine(2251)-2'-O)-methyltransferase RlmB [Bacilli bacterium]|jgi:23S rRNA (guanosine2251-2'-O)-methyltransferase|nr:23S rRNA (guanosine(2251)-2'-O)-methyltransferase RlmB [Bacilli bacterium]